MDKQIKLIILIGNITNDINGTKIMFNNGLKKLISKL